MAELDEKLLKALDDRLKKMLTTITSLDSALNTVVSNSKSSLNDLISLFQASGASLTDMLQAFKGNNLADLLGIKDAAGQVKQLNEQIETLKRNTRMGGKASLVEDADTGAVSWKVLEGDEFKNAKEERDAINALAEARQKLHDLTLSDAQLMEKIVSLINKAAVETQKEESAKEREFQKAVKQQEELARKYAELEKLRSETFGGRSYGQLSGKEKVQWTEMGDALRKIKTQMEEIEKSSTGSKAEGERIFKEQEAITRAKKEAAEEQTRIKREQAEQERLINEAIKDEERRRAAENKRMLDEEKKALADYIRLFSEKQSILKSVAPLDAKVIRNQPLTEQERGLYDASWNRIYAIQDQMAKLRESYVSVLEYEEKIQANGQEQVALGKVRLTQEQALAKEKERQAKSESKQQSDEAKIQKQADAIVKKRIDLERQVQRIDNDRAIRQQTNSKISQQALDAESRKYEALLQRINQLNNALSKLEGKQAGVTAKAEQRNAPCMNYVAAAEEERKAKAIENSTRKLKEQKNTLDSMVPTLQRLASAFGVAFSVRGLAQFGKKLIETRGEFERQQVALRSILQNKQLADEIWDKTMQAALQSPFTAMQLTTYTKQLAAYRIETDKLFETTKRLADVSAGLGVDMQRLILAYGQVKAANFLRASEIRQFTEAGVNILGELASYFTEIRGHAYSTAQVMEMVTKRMVRFEDVEAIFKRMTDAGGTFFNMQEVQANTVKGQINKLHDAYDQMLNTIGQANQGVIRNFISLLIDMVKNWQKVANTMKWVGGILGSVIIATRAMRIEMEATAFAEAGTAISLRGLSGAMARYIAAAKGAETATRGFSLALKSVPVWGWILAGVSALIGVGSAIASKQRQIREETEAFNESTKELRKDIAYVDSYTNAIVKLSTEIKALNEIENKTEEQEKRLVEAQEERERLIKELAETNPQYANTIKALKDDVDALLASEKEELETLKATLAIRQALKDEGVKGKVEEYESATAAENKAVSDIENNKIAIIDYIGTLNKAGEVESKLLDNLRKQSGTMSAIGKEGMSELESEVESFARAVNEDILNFDEAYGKFVDLYTKLSDGISKSAGQGAYYSNFIQVFKDAAQYGKALSDAQWDTYSAEIAIKGVLDEVFSKYKYYEQYISLSRAFEAATTEEEKQKIRAQILKFWSDVFDQEGFTGASRNLAEKYFVSMIGEGFGIKSFSQASETAKKGLEDWQKRVNEAIDKASKGFNEKRAQLSKEAQDNMLEIELYKIKDPFQTLEDAQSDILTRLKEVRARIASYEVKGQVAIDNAEYQALKLTEEELEQVRILLGAVAKVTGGGGHRENASKLISLIKEMRSEYDKLSKSAYGYAKSEEKVRESYTQSVEKILGKAGVTKDYDFTTNEGMIAALNKVLVYANKLGKDAAAEVQKYIDQLETEIEINAQVRIREDFGKKIEEMFSNYDLTLDLEKLSLPTDELEGIFKFDHTTLDELRKAVDDFYNQQIALGDDPTELVKQVEGYYKKIDEMEKKELRERLKTYSKYLAEGQVEALKIHLEELKKMAELDKLYEQGYFTDTQYKDISNKIRKETDEKLAKNDWQQFKESDFYVTMFEDMSRVSSESIDVMIKRLRSLRKSVNDLNPKQAKEIVKAIEKLEKTKLERSPLKSFLDDWKAAAKWRKDNDNLVKQLGFYASGDEYWSKEQDEQSKRVAELRLEYEELVKNGTPEDAADVKKRLDFEEEELSRINEILEDRRQKLDQINQEQNEGFAAQQRVLAGLAQGAQYFSDLSSTAGTISTEIMDMFDGVSDASKQLSKDIAEIAANVGILAGDIVKAIASEGTDVGSMIDGLVRTWNIIKGIFSASEYQINETIEKSTDKLKDLEFELGRVQRARERAWDTHAFTLAQKEIETNIYEQIEAYDALISAEEERKNKDEEQIRTWTQEREELFEQLEDERETLLKEFGGIGESEYKSAAQGFVDAWKSAFLETGDGLQGLQDHFDEFLNDWFVKQATMRVAGRMLEPLFRQIDSAVDQYGSGGANVLMQELQSVREKFGVLAPQLSDALEELAGMWGLGGEGSLSGLAAGIQGMTEEQANILEAYWNSVRGYTASIDMNVATIVGLLSNGSGGGGGSKGNIFGDPNVETNPMLKQLDLIAVNTAATHRILESVTKSGHSQGGYGIKVFAD